MQHVVIIGGLYATRKIKSKDSVVEFTRSIKNNLSYEGGAGRFSR